MPKPANKIAVRGQDVTVISRDDEDFICLTDIARYKDADATDDLIRGWLRNRNTIEFLGIWEQLNNPAFNPVEFDGFRKQAGLNSFTLTPKQWIEKTGAIGIISKAGRYGGTYAHVDIAFEFASWISVEFKLYLIKEFQRLKEQERQQLGWDIKRNLAKINYRIHTDAKNRFRAAIYSRIFANGTQLPVASLNFQNRQPLVGRLRAAAPAAEGV